MRRLAWVFLLSFVAGVPAAFGQVTVSVDAPSSVQLGIGLKYIITVTNTGASSIGGVVVTDNLPSGLSATSVSSNCAGTTAVICDIGALAAGQNATAEIELVPQAAGPLMNTATVTGGASATVTTSVISNGVVLSVSVLSSNPLDLVTSSPAGLTCNGVFDIKHRCLGFFPAGSNVTLSASGPNFVGWKVHGSKGACPGIGACTVTMSQEQRVDANFTSPIGFALQSLNWNGAINSPFDVDLNKPVIGGIGSIAPYTFSISAGTLPAGLGLSGSVIGGTPTVTGVFPVTVQLQDSSVPQQIATINLTITIVNPPNTQPGLLNGQYALLFRGGSDADASGRALVASLNFDGKGGITGVLDSNGNGSSPGLQTLVPVNGTYSIGPDNRGLIVLNNGSIILAIAVGEVSNGIAAAARIIRFDDNTGTGTRGAGFLRMQDPAAFPSSAFAGTWIYGLTGAGGLLQRVVELGLLSMDNAGNVGGGPDDFNNTFGVFHSVSIAGTYTTPTAAGRTVLNLIYTDALGNAAPFSLVAYVVDANNVFLMSISSHAIEAGTAERQSNPGSFTNSSLAGPDVINLQGPSGGTFSSDSFALLGTTSFASPTASITYDSNNARIVQIQGVASGPYSVASNGVAQISLSGSPAPPIPSLIAYLIGPDHGYVMSAAIGSNPDPFFGEIDLQQGGPFVQTSFVGNYFFGDREPASPSGGPVTSGTASVNACTVSHTTDQSRRGGELTYDVSGSFGFAVSSAGRVTTTFAQSGQFVTGNLLGNIVGYLVSPSRGFFSGIDPAEHHPEVVEVLAISPTPTPTLVSIAVSPASATISVGGNQQYTATGTYSDGSTQDLTSQVTWITSNLNAAPINATGLASGAAAGAADILASLGCLSSASTGPVTLTVTGTPGSTATSFVSSAGTSVYGQQVTFTATVSSVSGAGIPTGTVTFFDGAISLGVGSLTGGQAQITVSSLAAGTHSITAVYSGDTTFSQSTSPVGSQIVTPAPLTITANNAMKILDASNPPFSANYSGFVNGDTPAGLTGTLSCNSTATTTSPVGSYPVTCTGQSSTNYSITYVPGSLKILYATGGMCDGQPGHQILPPINADGSSVYNQGRTVPAKFRVCDANGVSIAPPPNVVASFLLTAIITGTTATQVEDVVDTNVPDAAFRWDPTAQQWIFNITTVNLAAGSTYVYTIVLNDGSTIIFQFGLR